MATKLRTKRAMLLGFIGSIAVCGLFGIICLLKGNIGRIEGGVLGSTALVGAASILGLASAIPWERRRGHPIGPVGIVVVACALVLGLTAIWMEMLGVWDYWWREEVLWNLNAVAWVFAVAIPLIGLLSLARLHRRYGWVRRWTIVAVVCLASLITYVVLVEPGYGVMDTLMRVVGILAILVVCGTLAVPVFHRVSAIKTREAVRTVELCVSLTCPRCTESQELAVGRSKCSKCGLRFSIEIEEDQCEARGYPLYRLESAVCPECGTPIAQEPASG